MTKCKLFQKIFQVTKSRTLDIGFNGGDITSDAGLIVIRAIDEKLGLTKGLVPILSKYDHRNPDSIEHSAISMFLQRVYAIACGYEDLNDHNCIDDDVLMQTVVQKDSRLASPSTLCRYENKATRELNVELSKEVVERFIKSHKSPPSELVLDFDATDSIIHGTQEGRFFNGFYESYCYMPLYVFCGDQLLVSYLRPSNIDGAKHAWVILSLLVKRFRQEWPDVRIIMRADSGFCRHKMLNWCESNNVGYIIGLASNERLNRLSGDLSLKVKSDYETSLEKQKQFTEFLYAAGTWAHPRRIIAKCEYNPLGPNTRYIVTNLEGGSEHLYSKVYCARGDMENRIKEQQLYLFADRTSSHSFQTNQFRLLLSAFAYVLLERLRALVLQGTEFANAQCNTIRLKLLKIGAIIRRNTRTIHIALSSAYAYKNTFLSILNKIVALR